MKLEKLTTPRMTPRRPEKVRTLWNRRGCYTLVISLGKTQWIRVGRLGKACFPKGVYLYTGSAMSGLGRRLFHYLNKSRKKRRWHIDYLLDASEARIRKILLYRASLGECRINQRIAKLRGAKTIVRDFGASDCTHGCGSHLQHFDIKIPLIRDSKGRAAVRIVTHPRFPIADIIEGKEAQT